ncbi:acyl-CoA synthetase short-chain family member 3, mitochondrial-like [Biomphalaria glabrata]|uniref:Acyl-CoA synthetase short-chain family member 3, mitochondrial n=1 Tax=Biomphalaria glabrata TaxID=6526 RepID=A0A9W3BLS9_BIOGL|nr:acyl-CoA synthetase short-chain family member 3, mitochondrial-like [Biomphalaria glabrata]
MANLGRLVRSRPFLQTVITDYVKCVVYSKQDELLSKKIHHRAFSDYPSAFKEALEKPEDFWSAAAANIDWIKKWDNVLDTKNSPFTRWFVGGELNTCYNALDRHIKQGRGDQAAIIYDSPVTKSTKTITYKGLLKQVQDFAGALKALGVNKGDKVLIYMPMIPEAIVAMLACARIGAIHSLVFGGFAARELSTRIAHAEPKVIVSANCGVEPTRTVPYKPMLDEALKIINYKPNKCIIFNRDNFDKAVLNKGQDIDWNDAVALGKPADCVPVAAVDPLYILYTSGTTGIPKAVVRPSGGHAVALSWSISNVYGMKPGQVWWAASDLGWVVGHSFITYAPLIHGLTTVLYEGKPVGTPDPGAFFRVIQQHQVSAMFVAPTALRAIRAEDEEGSFAKPYLPLDKFEALFVAGEHCDHETMHWIQELIKKPILDNWWQTETGWPMTATCRGLAMNLYPLPGTTGKPVPGWNVKVLRANGEETNPGELGQIYVKEPLPPGFMSTMYKNEKMFAETYFTKLPGHYDTMDSGIRDKDGYISVLSRSDDVINVAGHRLSCGSIEEAILECLDVVEAAVVGVPDKLKGSVPLGLCVLKHGCHHTEDSIKQEVIKQVRTLIGPVAAFKMVVIVPKLPKTRSGKVARNTIAALAAGKPFKIPVTIDDPTVYPAIQERLQAIGYAQGKLNVQT